MRRGTMFVREYIYTFIHGQPAFTEVTLIVDRCLSSPPPRRREETRDSQNKRTGRAQLSRKKAASRQRAFLKTSERHTRRTHTFFFFLLNQTTTQQQPKPGLARARFTLRQCSGKPAVMAQESGRVFNLSVSEAVALLRGVDNRRVISPGKNAVIDAVVMHSRTVPRNNDTNCAAPLVPYDSN